MRPLSKSHFFRDVRHIGCLLAVCPITICTALFLAGCDKPQIVPIEPEPPTSSPATEPASTPQEAPSVEKGPAIEETPQQPPSVQEAREEEFLPEGTLVVQKGISVTTETGIHRLPEGALVQVVSVGDAETTVESKGAQFTAPHDHFSNSVAVHDAIHAQKKTHAQALIEKSRLAKERELQMEQATRDSSREYHQNLAKSRVAEAQASLAALDRRIETARREVEDKRNRGYVVREYYNGYGWRYVVRGRTGITLSQDAAQLDQLQEARRAMAEKVRAMEAKANTGP